MVKLRTNLTQFSVLATKTKRFFVVILSLGIMFTFFLGLIRQLTAQRQISRNLTKKQLELKKLEEENKLLSEKLKETEKPEFVEEQAAKLLGMSKDGEPIIVSEEKTERKSEEKIIESESPNYLKWWKLFVY